VTCPDRNNQTWLHLVSYKTWFTLFFIPVIPYESKDLLLGPMCSVGLELQGPQMEKAKRLNLPAERFLANEIPEAQ